MGKGSGRRPQQVSDDHLKNEWARLFPKEAPMFDPDDFDKEMPEQPSLATSIGIVLIVLAAATIFGLSL